MTQDSFFAKQRQANFGDLGVAVKGLLDDYQAQAKLNENIQSIDDMHKFLDRYKHIISLFAGSQRGAETR